MVAVYFITSCGGDIIVLMRMSKEVQKTELQPSSALLWQALIRLKIWSCLLLPSCWGKGQPLVPDPHHAHSLDSPQFSRWQPLLQCNAPIPAAAIQKTEKVQPAPQGPAGEKNTKHLCNRNHCESKQGSHKIWFCQLLFRAENKCKPSTVFSFYARDIENLRCLKSGD